MSLFHSTIFISFGSGSCGNCYYLGTPTDGILIDVGIGPRKLNQALNDYGVNRSNLRAILLTHDHSDHVKYAAHMSEKLSLPVYATQPVHEGILRNPFFAKKIAEPRRCVITHDTPLLLGDFTIQSFPIPHDATANTGYTITLPDGIVFSLMTDVGNVTAPVAAAIRRSTHVVLESNYDPEMLRTGRYPKILQQRISNGTGHLSNYQTAQALIDNHHPRLRHVWLCHLSAENNRPELARQTVCNLLAAQGIATGDSTLSLTVLERAKPTGPFTLS